MTPFLAVEDLSVSYGAGRALSGVSFHVEQGEVVTIIGANGAGKSTTLKTIAGWAETAKSVAGSVRLDGIRIDHLAAHRIAGLGVAHVPEGRRLFAGSTVEENLLLGGHRHRRDRKATATRVAEVYERFPILSGRRDERAGNLSGGEQQMLAIGRALMSRPRVLLLDEPSHGLAPQLVAEVFRIIAELAAEGTTILLVEQRANQALAAAGRAYVLEAGRITASGAAADLARDPRVRAAFLGA